MDNPAISLNWTAKYQRLTDEPDIDNYSNQMNSVTSCVSKKVEFGILIFMGLISMEVNDQAPVVSFSQPSFEVVQPFIESIDLAKIESEELLREELKEEVTDLSKLLDNWDGEGANRVSTTSISHALDILDNKYACLDKISSIYANRNGFVSIQWENKEGQMVGIELGRKQMSYFVTLKDNSIYHDSELINKNNLLVFFKNLALL